MKNIRPFILTSSLFLCAWLAASYTHELGHNAENTSAADPTTSAGPGSAMPVTGESKDLLTTTASLGGVK